MDLSELFPPLIRPTEGWQITSAPYDYQERDHDETFRLWDEGVEGAMTRIFTGGGKTYSTCNKARTWLNRGDDYYVMIISYEKQLVWQFAQEIEDFLGIPPGIEMECEVVDPRRIPRIVVASRASLLIHEKPTLEMLEELETRGITQVRACTKKRCTAYLRALKKGASVQEIVEDIERANALPEVKNGVFSRVHKFDPTLNWMLCFDEAHKHSYRMVSVGHIVDWFGQNPKSRRMGMTATPKRSDGVSLGDKMFPAIAIDYPLYHRSKPCAVKDGYAVPYVQKYIEVEGVDFTSIKQIAGDFDTHCLDEMAEQYPATDEEALATPNYGGRFKRDWFRYYRASQPGRLAFGEKEYPLERIGRRFLTVDPAASVKETAKADPDWTVISAWGQTECGLLV